MKTTQLFPLICIVICCGHAQAQKENLVAGADPDDWTVFNRKVTFKKETIHLNAKASDGLLILNDVDFKNGTIELDIKGKNTPGRSFVGMAFHVLDNSTFDAVYFRPFNFRNPQRNSHSIQYISMPDNDWSILRKSFPGKYEHTIDPVPEPVDGWFHVRIEVEHPEVKVFVNGAEKPTLQVEQISERKHGKLGFWVGNGSEGWFRDLKITHAGQ